MRERIGTIALLQIQRRRLKSDGVYDPSPLLASDRMLLTGRGVLVAGGGGWMVDAHHASHPSMVYSKSRTLSIGFTAHYDKMIERFGERSLGFAGENIVIETERIWTLEDLAHGVVLGLDAGEITLTDLQIARPCIPFTRFLTRRPQAAAEELQEELAFLENGTRGFVAATSFLDQPVEVKTGDEVWLGR